MSNIILLISGKASAGKDTLWNYVKGDSGIKLPFADEVRKQLCIEDPLVDYNRLCNEYDYKIQYRKKLVEIGDGYRQHSPNIWVEKQWINLKSFLENNDKKIIGITDVRYRNELLDYPNTIETYFPEDIVLKIRVTASPIVRYVSMGYEGYMGYRMIQDNDSECALDNICYTFFDLVWNNDIEMNLEVIPALDPLFNFIQQVVK